MIPQHGDPLKEALQGDRTLSQDVIFGKVAVWALKIATVGTTGVFTWSLISNSLPKDASTIMVAFAGVGAFMLEVCFLLATIWIKISKNGIQTALAWSIFAFSLLCLLANIIAGAILAEDKQATLGRGWIDLYLVLMPATGVLCTVLLILWSLASPEASAARRNSIAQGLVAQRYETARLRTALHDVALNEVVDQAASRDAWQAVSRNLGIPHYQVLPASQPTNAAPPALPSYSYSQEANLSMQLQPTSQPATAPIAAARPTIPATDKAAQQPASQPTLAQVKPVATYAADSGSDLPSEPSKPNSPDSPDSQLPKN